MLQEGVALKLMKPILTVFTSQAFMALEQVLCLWKEEKVKQVSFSRYTTNQMKTFKHHLQSVTSYTV